MPKFHAVLQDSDQEPGNDIDSGNQDAGHGVALRESRCAVHGAEEFRLGGEVLSPGARFRFVDQPGIEIGVDRHLFARQGIQREARRHFRNANRAMVDDDVLNRDQNQEDHRADNVVAADHEAAERLDHVSGRRSSGISVQQNESR